jgi:hypothetical protein
MAIGEESAGVVANIHAKAIHPVMRRQPTVAINAINDTTIVIPNVVRM